MHRDDKTRIGVRSLSLIALLLMAGAPRRVRRAVQARGRAGQPGAPAGRPDPAGRAHLGAPQRGRPGREGHGGRGRQAQGRRPAGLPEARRAPGQQAAQPVHPVQPRDQGAGGRDRRGAAAGSARGAAGPDLHLPLAGRQALRDARRAVRRRSRSSSTRCTSASRWPSPTRPPSAACSGSRSSTCRSRAAACSASRRRARWRASSRPGPCRGSTTERVRGVRVYQVSNSTALLRAHRRLLVRERTGGAAVPRTVFLLGLTSLFTDISSEMVVTILPLYLVYVGGFTPLAFGVIDGIYNGAAALVGLASGFVGDRFRRHKEVATAGYGLSAVCKLAAGHRRHGAVGHRRDGAHRPHRQGHPHGPARRDDLAVHARAPARRRLRRAPRAGHDRGDDRPAAGLRAAGPRAAGLQLDLPRQLLHRAHRPGHPRPARPAQAGARRRQRAVAGRALAARAPSRCSASRATARC